MDEPAMRDECVPAVGAVAHSGPLVAVASSRLSLDHPTGRYVNIPSGITNQVVRYFIPDPLGDLFSRCDPHGSESKYPDESPLHAAALLRLAARRGYAGTYNSTQACHLFDLLWLAPEIESVEDLVGVAVRATPHISDIRRQIVFTGSRVASHAVHVYAPHEAVPELMQQMVEGIRRRSPGVSIVDTVSVLGFFCLHMHPFRDGNGRWTRAVALSLERRSLMPAIAAMSLQTICMRHLAETVWPQAQREGLRNYLQIANAYTRELLNAYTQSWAYQVVGEVEAALTRAAHTPSRLRMLARCLFMDGQLQLDQVKQLLGCSTRVVNGLFSSLEDAGLERAAEGVSFEPVGSDVSDIARSVALELFQK